LALFFPDGWDDLHWNSAIFFDVNESFLLILAYFLRIFREIFINFLIGFEEVELFMLFFTLFGESELVGDGVYLWGEDYFDGLRLEEIKIAIKVIQLSTTLVYYFVGGFIVLFLLLGGFDIRLLFDDCHLLFYRRYGCIRCFCLLHW
jgi:hypothetical protein